MEAETAGKTLSDVEAQAPVDTPCSTLLEVVAKTIGDTLTYVETVEPVKTLADTLANVKA